VLDPDVVLRADWGTARPGASRVLHGAKTVAKGALAFSQYVTFVQSALVNGVAGVAVVPQGQPFSVMAFTVVRGKIVEIDLLAESRAAS
jgi:RNA polymerase sigma-70 factor (ECF subfamily)